MGLHDDAVFLGGPLLLADGRAQLVVPTFAALLANASLEVRRYEGPVVRAVADGVSVTEEVGWFGSGADGSRGSKEDVRLHELDDKFVFPTRACR